jgi:hypothetical protein
MSGSITTVGDPKGLTVSLVVSNQWSGTFEGTITLSNNSNQILDNWSITFNSRYALTNVSNFSIQQVQSADGTWSVTLRPPSWGTRLTAGLSASSYVQGTIPGGARLDQPDAALVLVGGAGSMPAPIVTPVPVTPTPPVSPLPAGGTNSGNSADKLWGEAFYAPYVDMALYPVPDLDGLARKHGVGLFTLAFLQATPSGEPAWGGLQALSLTSTNDQAVAIRREIAELRAAGGDVMVSMGGAAGTSQAQSFVQAGRSAADLAASYGNTVDTLALNRLDFDIEGAAIADSKANLLQSTALGLLQKSHPNLELWYTLPVLPQGLTREGLTVVGQALDAGVRLDGINLMTMDYGDSAAPPSAKSMGAYAIDAANSSYQQLSSLFATHGLGFGWNQLGMTPMIGVNDVISEVFTLADAQQVEDFARSKGLGMLSMWSLARDTPGPIGQVGPSNSGLAVPAGSFAALFGDYGTDPVIGAAALAAPGGATAGGSTLPADPLIHRTIGVAATSTGLTADASVSERFQVSYAWGRRLTISGFDPAHDVLDLGGFWAEGRQARVQASGTGSVVCLDFNQQQVLLPGVAAAALTPQVLAIWQG